MKVILLAELKGRGGEGDVIEVSRGFAVNYLLPRKVAVEATPGNLKQLEQRMHNIKKREEIRLADAGDFRSILDGKKIAITVKVGEAGRLFGSVTPMMIAEAIKEQLETEVDRRKIETRGAIKTIGEHVVEVAVYRDIKADLTVEVLAEGAVVPVTEVEAELAKEIEAAKAGEDVEAAPEAEEAVDAETAEVEAAPAKEAPVEEAEEADAEAEAPAEEAEPEPEEAPAEEE